MTKRHFGKALAAATIGSALILCVPSTGAAQRPNLVNELTALDAKSKRPSDDRIRELIIATATTISATQKTCAPTAIKIESVSAITGAAMVVDAIDTGKLHNGWAVMTKHVGCTNTGPFRYVVFELPDSSYIARFVNEGRSFANLSIMRDASKSAALVGLHVIDVKGPPCDGKDMKLGVTRVESQEPGLGPEIFGVRFTGSWTEIWPFLACGKIAEVKLVFRADGEGGAYWDIKQDQVRLIDDKGSVVH